jgi:hypothetical protein
MWAAWYVEIGKPVRLRDVVLENWTAGGNGAD